MGILIATTTAPYKASTGETIDWLSNAERLIEKSGHRDLHFFASIEVDSRGLEPFDDLLARLGELNAAGVPTDYWTYSFNDKEPIVDGSNRLVRICMGRNVIHEYAMRHPFSHVLFLDSDLKVPSDSLEKLLEVDKPIVGGDVPAYCMGGTQAKEYPFPVQIHWNTAGFLLVNREIVRRIRWRADNYDGGASDDPCFAADVEAAGFGPTYVRKDVIGVHRPLVPLEKRGHDLERKLDA